MAECFQQPFEPVEKDPAMSLLSKSMTACTMLTKTAADDGYGGVVTTRTEGESFDAAIVFDTSLQARQAEVQGVTSRYIVTTKREKVLKFHDVFRRKSDGKIFRVTSDGGDKQTPISASLDMMQVTAEEWSLDAEVANG